MGRRREGKYNLKNLWVVVFWPVADGKKKKKERVRAESSLM